MRAYGFADMIIHVRIKEYVTVRYLAYSHTDICSLKNLGSPACNHFQYTSHVRAWTGGSLAFVCVACSRAHFDLILPAINRGTQRLNR
jgi:hypothetical protein